MIGAAKDPYIWAQPVSSAGSWDRADRSRRRGQKGNPIWRTFTGLSFAGIAVASQSCHGLDSPRPMRLCRSKPPKSHGEKECDAFRACRPDRPDAVLRSAGAGRTVLPQRSLVVSAPLSNRRPLSVRQSATPLPSCETDRSNGRTGASGVGLRLDLVRVVKR